MIGFLIYLYTVLVGLEYLALTLAVFLSGLILVILINNASDEKSPFREVKVKNLIISFFILASFVCLVPSKKELAVIVGVQMVYDSKAFEELNQATGIGAEYIKELLKAELKELKESNNDTRK